MQTFSQNRGFIKYEFCVGDMFGRNIVRASGYQDQGHSRLKSQNQGQVCQVKVHIINLVYIKFHCTYTRLKKRLY